MILWTFVAIVTGAFLYKVAYNLYAHPLSRYPGPKTWAAFRLPMLACMMSGQLPYRIKALHDQYGKVVRIAPDELSFIDPQAWKDIYSRRDFHRPAPWRGKPPGVTDDSFFSADEHNHARLRKAFGPAFSDKAVRSYEPTVVSHTDKLLRKIDDQTTAQGGKATLDMVRWLNFCLFDIIGDLGWGTTFALLDRGDYHPWVTITLGFKALLAGTCLAYYPPLDKIAVALMPKSAREGLDMIIRIARENVDKRLKEKSDRADVFSYVLKQGDGEHLESVNVTRGEMEMCSMSYNAAGSEPVTTTLCGLLSHLLASPKSLELLVHEIRSNLADRKDVTTNSTQRLPYLTACLKETLRLCPPIPDGMRRQVTEPGATIAGERVQGGTVVSVSCLAAFTSDTNFQDARVFRPERWLAQPEVAGGLSGKDFARDHVDAYNPFSYGSRNCLGVNLAWVEMRILASRLMLEFDVSIPDGETLRPWDTQDIFWTWDKRPMMVQLERRGQ